MLMRKIIIYPDPVLKKKSEEVGKIDEEILQEVEELKKTLVGDKKGAGLAAPQIGISKRFFGIKRMQLECQPLCLCNILILKDYSVKRRRFDLHFWNIIKNKQQKCD